MASELSTIARKALSGTLQNSFLPVWIERYRYSTWERADNYERRAETTTEHVVLLVQLTM